MGFDHDLHMRSMSYPITPPGQYGRAAAVQSCWVSLLLVTFPLLPTLHVLI